MLLSLPLLLVAADVALVGGTVHSMGPGEEPRVATVLIQDQRIALIAPDIEIPPGTERYDVTGKHLVPGLIDGMVNCDRDHDALYVIAGITAVRDIGGRRIQNLLERNRNARERTPGPTLYTAGAPLDGDPPASRESVVIRSPASAEGALSILLQDEPDFLHVLPQLDEKSYRKILELAAESDVDVWGPVPTKLSALDAVAAGQRGFLYIDRFLPQGADWAVVQPMAFDVLVDRLAETSSRLVPVLHATVAQLAFQNESKEGTALLQMLAPTYEQWWTAEALRRAGILTEEVLAEGRRGVEKRRDLLGRLHRAGVQLVPGSGAPMPWLFPGQALHQELDEWVQAGLPREEVLELATRRAAEALGIADDHGTIAPGKLADIICVAEDPREDLRRLLDPDLVVLRGRVLERNDLDDLIETLRVQQSEIRERLLLPLDVAAPPAVEGAVVLAGRVEAYALRNRVSAERFAVVRQPDGMVALTGRVVYPDENGDVLSEMTVEQYLRDGRLERFLVTHRQDRFLLTCEGIRLGETFRIRRRLDGKSLEGTEIARVRIRTLDVDSVTSLIALGQLEVEGTHLDFPVLVLHEMMVPEVSMWRLQMDDGGDHQVRTHQGQLAFRLDEKGTPLVQRLLVGQIFTETRLLSSDTFGGPGFPLPPEKAKRVAAARARAAAEEAAAAVEAGSGDGTTPPPTEDDEVEDEEGDHDDGTDDG